MVGTQAPHPRHGTDRGVAWHRTHSNCQLTFLGQGTGAPEGMTLNLACQRTIALLCVRTADTWWNNRFGFKKKSTQAPHPAYDLSAAQHKGKFAHWRGSLPPHNLVSDSGHPHHVSDPQSFVGSL